MDHAYYLGEGAKEDEVGPPGRVFLTGYPESSPDLRLYSTKEHPLRDVLVSCGLRGFLALPVFDFSRTQCLGVLELLNIDYGSTERSIIVEQALQKAYLRSTHINYMSDATQNLQCKEPPKEIREMLELAVDAIPQLHLAQVWIPCTQCGHIMSCMERAAFMYSGNMKFNSFNMWDFMMRCFIEACNFQRRPGKTGVVGTATTMSCFVRNLCDVSKCEYPLAHYAQQARLSSCFTVCLQSTCNVNDLFIVEFFLHPHSREDAYLFSTLQLLLQVMKKKLTSFKITSEEQLTEVPIGLRTKNCPASFQSDRSDGTYEMIKYVQANEHESSTEFTLISRIAGYNDIISFSYLKNRLRKVVLSVHSYGNRWLFCCPQRKELLQNQSIQEKVRLLIMIIISSGFCSDTFLIQFWEVRRQADKSFLTTLDQPFALGTHCKGLCWYKKHCMDRQCFVDEGAKEEELGPLGRVFRHRCPESTPNFRLYSTEEFPQRDYAIQCGFRTYLALPIFNLHESECLGVLEWIDMEDANTGEPHTRLIRNALEVANLESHHFGVYSLEQGTQKINQDSALRELKEMLRKVIRTSQSPSVAQVWVPCSQCTDTHKNLVCVRQKLVESCSAFKINRFMCKSHKVETGKGITGILLLSENKSCFFPNLCHFSITEEPQAHVVQVARFNVCFAICLQSSYTGSNLYILQFFLNLPSRKYEHLCSFLSFLLLMMKDTLKSFRVASGKQLGEELVVEVISLDKNDEFTEFELHQPDVLPVRFVVTQYVDKEPRCQHSTSQSVHDTPNRHDSSVGVPEAEPDDAASTDSEEGVRVTTRKTEGERNTTSFHISYDDLQLHFGKRLEDVEKALGVSRSTLKRACRGYGIKRWPSCQNNKKNPSLFETSTSNKRVRSSDQQVLVSSSNNPPPQISPVHNQNVLQTSGIESSQNHTKLTEDGFVLIKAKFGEDTVKLQLLLSSGIEKLKEEVGKRFNLMNGSFKLYYLDEDEWILLACDDDLQLCMKTSTASGKTPIQILVK